ncbi:MAG: V-type ATP synthase subunit D [Desulfuromonas sp.]|nr:MAG: V-type ATP synthase subunit D [Desulfuromonas sp.]
MMQPTRTNLLLLRERLRAVFNCIAILKGRRQALIKEFLQVTRPLLQSREAISQEYASALFALQVTAAREGDIAMNALVAANRRQLAVDVEERNLLGLRYHDVVSHESVTREFSERPFDVVGPTPWLDETLARFEEIVEALLDLASFEGKFRRLAEELIRMTRRIRVLEERVVPKLHAEIHHLSQFLAEREREGYFRLKRFKKIATRRQQSPAAVSARVVLPG